MIDGHSILVTPDPVPNSEVKLDVFAFVLSLMGRRGAVYFIDIFLGRKIVRENSAGILYSFLRRIVIPLRNIY